MYHFYTNILKAIFSKKSVFDRIYAYFKTGVSALIVLSLYFVLLPSLQAQEVLVGPPGIGFNPDSSVINFNNNDYVIINIDTLDNNHYTIMVVAPQQQDTVTSKKQFYFALKNNLLYDAVLLPNLTAEAYLGKQFSLAIEGNWSWWTFKKPVKSKSFYRIQSLGAEFRYWFKSPYPLQGHAVGVYSMVGDYDIRLFTKNENSKGSLSYGSWSAGFSYAYSMPLVDRVGLEFGLAVGYLGGKYYDYNYCIMHERWEQQAKYNRRYIGPTRVGVSVVWQLGNGNNTRNKGVHNKGKE